MHQIALFFSKFTPLTDTALVVVAMNIDIFKLFLPKHLIKNKI